ncbi:MAG: SdpI family protein, partial [Candidatus Eremiobacteraeota bacterium]|nr:SdpI family protein [Candidatus Eremiobacteraeota bacterium]
AGNVNGYSSLLSAVSAMPVSITICWLLTAVLPAISPRGFRLGESAGAFYVAMLAVLTLLLIVHLMLLHSAMTQAMPSLGLLVASIGALFIVLGMLVARAKKNFWFGVRTPWTLASDEVWRRSNHFGGRLMVAGGIIAVLASFFSNARMPVLVAIIAVIAFAPILYSYAVYRRIEGFDSEA